jgi:hypothetical protein
MCRDSPSQSSTEDERIGADELDKLCGSHSFKNLAQYYSRAQTIRSAKIIDFRLRPKLQSMSLGVIFMIKTIRGSTI